MMESLELSELCLMNLFFTFLVYLQFLISSEHRPNATEHLRHDIYHPAMNASLCFAKTQTPCEELI
jgi:hypothetical protein